MSMNLDIRRCGRGSGTRWAISAGLLSLLLGSCSQQVKAPARYEYRFVNGYTPLLRGPEAAAPHRAPDVVKRIVAAANELQGKPYRYGGGHASIHDHGYDCSGTVSYVLNRSGLMSGTLTSSGFMEYGRPGPGKWVTIYSKPGHVFLVVGGLRLDTGGQHRGDGPKWKPKPRSTNGFVLRHPRGL